MSSSIHERNVKTNELIHKELQAHTDHMLHNNESTPKLLKDVEHTLNSIEERIGTDTSSSPLSQTALLRNQKDIIDNKLSVIAGFLDKDNSQFHLKHHTTSNLVGNTSADGTGSHNHVHVDSNGVVKVQNIASVNVLPANAVNSGITNDPANSIAVGLRARTDIADASTETFLKCSAAGVLEVSGGGGGGGGDSTAANQTTMIGHLAHNGVGVAEQAKNIEDTMNSIETLVQDGGKGLATHVNEVKGHLIHNSVSVAEQAKNIEDTMNSVEALVQDGGKSVATHVNEVKGHLVHNNVSVAAQAKNIEDTLNSVETLVQDGGKSVATHVNEVKGHLVHNSVSVAEQAKNIEDTLNSIENRICRNEYANLTNQSITAGNTATSAVVDLQDFKNFSFEVEVRDLSSSIQAILEFSHDGSSFSGFTIFGMSPPFPTQAPQIRYTAAGVSLAPLYFIQGGTDAVGGAGIAGRYVRVAVYNGTGSTLTNVRISTIAHRQ